MASPGKSYPDYPIFLSPLFCDKGLLTTSGNCGLKIASSHAVDHKRTEKHSLSWMWGVRLPEVVSDAFVEAMIQQHKLCFAMLLADLHHPSHPELSYNSSSLYAVRSKRALHLCLIYIHAVMAQKLGSAYLTLRRNPENSPTCWLHADHSESAAHYKHQLADMHMPHKLLCLFKIVLAMTIEL